MTEELLKQADEYLEDYNGSFSSGITRAVNIIKALADEVRGKEWQPIKDAPKDRRLILRNDEFFAYYGELQEENGKWCRGIMLMPEPTHYLDLPQPKKEQ